MVAKGPEKHHRKGITMLQVAAMFATEEIGFLAFFCGLL